MNNQDQDIHFFSECIREYYMDLERFISTFSDNVFDRDDILQNVLERAFVNIGQVTEKKKVKTWLFTIAVREARRFYKNIDIGDATENPFAIEINVDEQSVSEEDVFNCLAAASFNQIIKKLDGRYAQIIIYKYYFDLPLKDVAKMLGLKYNTVITMHRRAINKLKEIHIKIPREKEIRIKAKLLIEENI